MVLNHQKGLEMALTTAKELQALNIMAKARPQRVMA